MNCIKAHKKIDDQHVKLIYYINELIIDIAL